jgi:glucose 1-dehydrogenase
MTANRRLEGKCALVTGANSGIGESIARSLASAGACVFLNYIANPEAADRIVQDIHDGGGRAEAIKADVSDESQVEAMFGNILETEGALDILVSNAGVQKDAPLVDMELSQWRTVLDVNLTGGFLCARAAARHYMKHAEQRASRRSIGCIVFTSSVHERIPWTGHANYAASKGGLNMLMKTAAQEWAPHRIRVLSVGPGAIATPINEKVWKDPERREQLMDLIPYGRIGSPEEIGQAVAWLVSDDADYITGTTLYVDGGMLLYPGFHTGG